MAPLANLSATKAREFAAFLQGRDDVAVSFIEARESEKHSWIVVEVEVDVGQKPVVEIERRERFAIGFQIDDTGWPTTVALREDFPAQVNHQFLMGADHPTTLCLSEEPWDEFKRRWTPYQLVRLIRRWLSETARGDLHGVDQPLEPFVAGSPLKAVMPATIANFCDANGALLYGYRIEENGQSDTVRFYAQPLPSSQQLAFAAAGIALPPQPHGIIRYSPHNLAELRELLGVGGFDFAAALDAVVKAWLGHEVMHSAVPILIVSIPVTRTAGADVERTDFRLFLLDVNVRELGISLDLWSQPPTGSGGFVLTNRDPKMVGGNVAVSVLNPVMEITREDAAKFSGFEAPTGKKVLAVGAGALGSQIIGNLIRMGETISGVADIDRLLPHNQVRHGEYAEKAVGHTKALAVAMRANEFLGQPGGTSSFIVDAVVPTGRDAEAYLKTLSETDVVLDMAASVAVSRHLAIDAEANGRRIAAFLNPSGYDLVILAEDADRQIRLDELEMAYYAAILNDQRLHGHLSAVGHLRYAQSCRELSARIPQSFVGMHAGLGAHVIRQAIEDGRATATVWRTDLSTMATTPIEIDPHPFNRYILGDWTVMVSPGMLEQLDRWRAERLPNETGGVLLGDFDTTRKLIYLAAALPAPEDSQETSGGFVRGAYGLADAIKEVEQATQLMLRYTGEWHSHPTGYGVCPSGDDVTLYSHMAEQMEVEGYPPIMLIIGDNEHSLIVEGFRTPLDPRKAA